MKKVFLLSSLALMLYACSGNKVERSAENSNVLPNEIGKLNIQYAKTYEYIYNYDENPENIDGFLKEVTEYDKNGLIVKNEIYHRSPEDQKYDLIETFLYDRNGNCIEKTATNKTSGRTEYSVKYRYENDRNIEYIIRDSIGKTQNKVIQKFDDKGRPIELKAYLTGDQLDYIQSRAYNDANIMTESKSYDNSGNLIESMIVNTNPDNTKERLYYNSNGDIKRKFIYTTDNKGHIIRSKDIDVLTETVTDTKNTFDENGLLIEEEIKVNKHLTTVLKRTKWIKFE